jgi:hypothetical protein
VKLIILDSGRIIYGNQKKVRSFICVCIHAADQKVFVKISARRLLPGLPEFTWYADSGTRKKHAAFTK